jgi:hypothetical protein
MKIIENYHSRQVWDFSHPAGVYPAGNHLGDTGERDPCVTYGGSSLIMIQAHIKAVKT